MLVYIYIILAEQQSPVAVINPLYLPRTPNGGNNTGRPGRAVISPWCRCHLAGEHHRDSPKSSGEREQVSLSLTGSRHTRFYRSGLQSLHGSLGSIQIVMAVHLLVLLRKRLFLCYCIFSFQDTQKDLWKSLQIVSHGHHRSFPIRRISLWGDLQECSRSLCCNGKRDIHRL